MRRKLHRKDKKQKKIIISLLIFLVLFLSVGYAAFQTNIFLKAKGNIVQKKMKINDLIKTVVTSGDGLYVDDTESERYIYKGVEPNNYIKLDSDTYRIISIESDGTLKVIKNKSIGNIPFDLGYISSISGVTDRNSVIGTRYTNTSTDYCSFIPGTESEYYGCNIWGSKTTMLDSSGNNITQMPKTIGGTTLYNLPEKEAYINTYLNSTWLNTLSADVQNKITNHIFNVGLIQNGETSLSNTISQEQTYKWKGKVGLMTISDYIKTNTNMEQCGSFSLNNTNYSICKATSWIFNSVNFNWLLTISPDSYFFNHRLYHITSNGKFELFSPLDTISTLPVFYLSSDIYLKGKGTANVPYRLVA